METPDTLQPVATNEATPGGDYRPAEVVNVANSALEEKLKGNLEEQFNEIIQSPPAPEPVAEPAAPAGRARTAHNVKPSILNGDNELTRAIKEINDKKGANTVRIASTYPSFNQIPTGIFALDYALLGGIHVGLATQVYGWENVGKTSMMLRIIRSLQERFPDKIPVIAPLEGTFDPEHALMFGVDTDKLLILEPDSGEAAIDEMVELYKARETSGIFLDSVPALIPSAIVNKSAEDKTMTEAARLGGILYSKLTQALWGERKRDHWVTFVAANQWRMKPTIYGNPHYLPGGSQQKFFYTNFIEIKSKEGMNNDASGQEVLDELEQEFHIKKAKVGAAIKEGAYRTVISPDHASGLRPGEVDDAAVVATIAKQHGLIGGSGQHWRVDGIDGKFGSLKEIKMHFYQHPMSFITLKQRIIAKLRVSRGRPAFPPDGHLLNHKKLF